VFGTMSWSVLSFIFDVSKILIDKIPEN